MRFKVINFSGLSKNDHSFYINNTWFWLTGFLSEGYLILLLCRYIVLDLLPNSNTFESWEYLCYSVPACQSVINNSNYSVPTIDYIVSPEILVFKLKLVSIKLPLDLFAENRVFFDFLDKSNVQTRSLSVIPLISQACDDMEYIWRVWDYIGVR